MPLPVAFTLLYLIANLAMLIWLERARARGETPPPRIVMWSHVLRWGLPVLGLVYLIAISGDWVFVLFVLAFFAGAFWLLDGLLAYTNHGPGGPDAPGDL
jgi:hypothetical protein